MMVTPKIPIGGALTIISCMTPIEISAPFVTSRGSQTSTGICRCFPSRTSEAPVSTIWSDRVREALFFSKRCSRVERAR